MGARIQKLTDRKMSGGVMIFSYRICYPEWENADRRNAFYRQVAENCRDYAEKEAEKKESEWQNLPRNRRRFFVPGSFLLLCEESEERGTVRIRLTAVGDGGTSGRFRRTLEQEWSISDEWMTFPRKTEKSNKRTAKNAIALS
ncbi:MAG: hypothetical protein KBS76_05045 [Ruminococcus sp.]|nr:hypothetical protein [Candidatus Apopatosoma intestinale]